VITANETIDNVKSRKKLLVMKVNFEKI